MCLRRSHDIPLRDAGCDVRVLSRRTHEAADSIKYVTGHGCGSGRSAVALRVCGDDRWFVLEATELLCVNNPDNDG
jgi:hypothetical protein